MMSHSVVRLGASPPDNMIICDDGGGDDGGGDDSGVMMVIIDQCVLIRQHGSGGWVGFN